MIFISAGMGANFDKFSLNHEACLICFNELRIENLVPLSLKCGHTLCNPCLEKLLFTNRECPSCRKEIRKSELVACSICFNEFENEHFIPMSLKCGHTFCNPCLDKLLSTSRECASCRKEIREGDPIKNFALLGVILDLKSQSKGVISLPKIIDSPSRDPMSFMVRIYAKIESGGKLMCVHQPSYESGLMYGKVSLWSNTLFFHCLNMKNSENCEEFLLFNDLKKVMTVLKIKTFMKVKSSTKASQILQIMPMESPLLSQYIRLCTGETGPSYKGSIYDKGADKTFKCKSVMKLSRYQKGSVSTKGIIEYAFETERKVYFKEPKTVVVGSLDGGFQIYHCESECEYKNVIGVIESPLNLKDSLSYDHAKILDSGIFFQL